MIQLTVNNQSYIFNQCCRQDNLLIVHTDNHEFEREVKTTNLPILVRCKFKEDKPIKLVNGFELKAKRKKDPHEFIMIFDLSGGKS